LQIYREEGLLAFWKGNGTNVIRVAPYAAAQLSSNDFYKRMLAGAHFRPDVPVDNSSLHAQMSMVT